MVALVAHRGYGGVTVRGLSQLAGVSTKSFYDCFRNVEECFVATYNRIVHDTLTCPNDLPSEPEDHARARFRHFFGALEGDSQAAHLVLIDAPSAGIDSALATGSVDRGLERLIGEEMAPFWGPTGLHKGLLVRGAAAAALHLARVRLIADEPLPTATADEFADWLLSLCGGQPDLPRSLGTPAWGLNDPATRSLGRDIGDDRRFLIVAVTKLHRVEGYAKLTVPSICREAGVSRRAFDRRFDGVAHCFLAAVEERIADAKARAEAKAFGSESWERAVVRITTTLCADLRYDTTLGGPGFRDILAPGSRGLELRENILARWARRLRRTAPRSHRPGQIAAAASVAAAAAIATANPQSQPERVAPTAAYLILSPAVGSAAAELAISSELRT